MKKYTVTLMLVIGYHGTQNEDGVEVLDYEQPRLKRCKIDVMADNEQDAIKKAKQQDTSKLSVYESFVEEK